MGKDEERERKERKRAKGIRKREERFELASLQKKVESEWGGGD